jgi:hypothetical protein
MIPIHAASLKEREVNAGELKAPSGESGGMTIYFLLRHHQAEKVFSPENAHALLSMIT